MISQEVSEEVLLAAVADVEIPGSLDAFYRSEFPRIVNIAYALSGGRLAAEDLAQDAMIAAHRQWNRVGALDKPGAWTRRGVISAKDCRSRASRLVCLLHHDVKRP
jgi:DNA-directed RNA polymerase specialized sigma24 family protein